MGEHPIRNLDPRGDRSCRARVGGGLVVSAIIKQLAANPDDDVRLSADQAHSLVEGWAACMAATERMWSLSDAAEAATPAESGASGAAGEAEAARSARDAHND